jgi:hypothetical protein
LPWNGQLDMSRLKRELANEITSQVAKTIASQLSEVVSGVVAVIRDDAIRTSMDQYRGVSVFEHHDCNSSLAKMRYRSRLLPGVIRQGGVLRVRHRGRNTPVQMWT